MTSEAPGDEVAALLALDALPAGEQADAELRAGLASPGLAEVAALLAEEAATSPPGDLKSGTLARALSRRPAGRPLSPPRMCEPLVAFNRTVADFRRLLAALSDADWNAPAHPEHGSVRDLVAHLVGVERLVLRWLNADDTVPDLPDHVAATRPVIAELAGADPRDLAREWHAQARAVAAAAAASHSRPVVFHDLTISVDQLLLTRASELWAHAIDICQATGRSMPLLDAERLATLCSELMAAVPLALTYKGTTAPGRAARFVLTGPAGGTFTVPLALEPAAEPAVTILTDAVSLCQLAIRRLRPEQLDAMIDGDRELGDLVLAGVGALARD